MRMVFGWAPVRLVRRFIANEAGATAIEYALIAAFVSIAAVGVWSQLGGNLQAPFQTAEDALD